MKTLNIKVKNMTSSNGNDIPNQFIISTEKGLVFQSYNSVIAFKSYEDGKIYLDNGTWDYSTTTGKYRNQFLGEDKKETQKKINSGEYILTDLN
jgi:hypothetical protein